MVYLVAMKRSAIVLLLVFGTIAITFGQIRVRIVTSTSQPTQDVVKNVLLRQLFVYEDVIVVDELENYRIDLSVKEISIGENQTIGYSIAMYLLVRIDWRSVATQLVNSGEAEVEEVKILEDLTSKSYVPVFLFSDIAGPNDIGNIITDYVRFLNAEHFEKNRPKPISEENSSDELEEPSSTAD